MADLVVTADDVRLISGKSKTGKAGAAITAGQALYADSTSNNKLKPGDNNASTPADIKTFAGIALNNAATDQPVVYAEGNCDIDLGATLTVGESYYMSDTPGGIAPGADIASGMTVNFIGVASAADTLLMRPLASGIVHA